MKKFSTLRILHHRHSLLNLNPNLNLNPSFSVCFNFNFATIPQSQSFVVSYLVSTCGFSPESALSASRYLRFKSSQKPDSVIAFLSAHGFSVSQIHTVVKRESRILQCNPDKVLLPKFQFLRSKGASSADIIHMITAGPRFLLGSLNNNIVPAYHLVRSFIDSDKQVITCLRRNFSSIADSRVSPNVQLLLDNGVKRSSIAMMLSMRSSILCSYKLSHTICELKEMGFDTSKTTFAVAMMAKRTVNKAKWVEKVEVFKKWGWSEEHVLEAFKKLPYCMLNSQEKIDAVFSFWVEVSGYSSLELVKYPVIFQLSLPKRIVPRSLVLKFLEKEGLRKKGASYATPLLPKENVFLKKFVYAFENHSSQLLKIYQKSMNQGNTTEESRTIMSTF
ncbi:uncharacterized protein LOC106767552 [Vigna radiata var. radiata]|uniref:Uncharacterized protein LOC106767552 n=1 Tax=Vigna radiata var. radiata TaxID=3916 RepID=A0A1S3UPN8_VIGRR|nr:uncharacterized protein LOC106767552 [Vigna radiata var. radiata]